MSTFVHIGLPKTATTSLQRNLFAQHPGVNHLGKPYQNEDFRALLKTIIACDEVMFEDVLARIKPCGHLLDSDKPTVISHERLSSDHDADRAVKARRLKAMFPDSRIILIVREQINCLESMYVQYLKGAPVKYPYCTFEEYLQAAWMRFHVDRDFGKEAYQKYMHVRVHNPLGRVHYKALLKSYLKHYAKDELLVLPFEQLKADPTFFLTKLSRFIGIDEETSVRLMTQQAPRQTRPSGIDIALKGSPLLLRLRGVASALLPQTAKKRLKAKLSRNISLDWPSTLSAKISDLYREPNRWLADEFSLPLMDLGYPI